MTYLEYKKRIELDIEDYSAIDQHSKKIGMTGQRLVGIFFC